MNIIKRVGFFLLVLFFTASAIYGYLYLRSIKKPSLDAFSQLPDSCVIYVRTNNFFELNRRINSRSLIADKMRAFKPVDELCRVLKKADSLFSANEELHEQIEDEAVHFALYGKDKMNWLVCFNIRELGRQEKIQKALRTQLNAVAIGEYYSTEAITGRVSFFSIRSGIIFISDSQPLLENCFDPNGPKFVDNPNYIGNRNTFSESNLLSLYVDHVLYKSAAANESINLGVLSGQGCSASSIDTDPSSFTVKGNFESGNSGIFNLLSHQEPQSLEPLINHLPSGTVSFKAWGLSGLPAYLSSYNSDETLIKYWKLKNEFALYNAEKTFFENAGNYLVKFISDDNAFLAMQVKDTVKADELIGVLADSSSKNLNDGIARLSLNDTTGLFLFKQFDSLQTNYVLRSGDFLYFSPAAAPLYGLRSFLNERSTLNTNASFMSYQAEHFGGNFNLLFYNSPSKDTKDIQSVIRFKAKAKEKPFENLKHLSFSLTNDNKHLRFRLHLLNGSEGEKQDEGSLWTFNADTLLQGGAFLFINHNSKERELVCQDKSNALYLLNAKGNRLWKKPLPEKIMSDVYLVDAFRNNKYQMLFNTKTHLYLIDRNGNHVEGFPVKLPNAASGPLSLFDYDQNKDYRIVMACGNTIFNFAITGKMLPGFKPVKASTTINLPVQYAKVGVNDYLVTLDSGGEILIFSRRGELRISLKNRAVAACKSFYVDAGSSLQNSYVVYFDDRSAILNKISFTDKKLIAKLDSEFEGATSVFTKIDENRLTDILISSGTTVRAYNLSGHRLLEKTFAADIHRAGYYSDENKSIVYGLSSEQKHLFILDQQTQKTRILTATELPLVVNLFRDNKKYLVVENGRQLTCLPLN